MDEVDPMVPFMPAVHIIYSHAFIFPLTDHIGLMYSADMPRGSAAMVGIPNADLWLCPFES